jgi:hypothetical protein
VRLPRHRSQERDGGKDRSRERWRHRPAIATLRPMKTTSLIAALGAAAAATAIAVLPASGEDQPASRTLTFVSTEKHNDTKFIDAKPKGPSIGDGFLLSSLLHSGSKIAGRIEGQCVLLDPTYHAQMCTITAILGGGRITLQGGGLDKKVPGIGGTDETYAVTGGTGAYVGAAGSMTRKGTGKKDTITFTLQ